MCFTRRQEGILGVIARVKFTAPLKEVIAALAKTFTKRQQVGEAAGGMFDGNAFADLDLPRAASSGHARACERPAASAAGDDPYYSDEEMLPDEYFLSSGPHAATTVHREFTRATRKALDYWWGVASVARNFSL